MADYWSAKPDDTVRNDPPCPVCHRKRGTVPWARECRSVVKQNGKKQGWVCCNALGSTCDYTGKDSRNDVADDDDDDDERPREETPLESVRGRQASIDRAAADAAAAFNTAHRPRAGHTRGVPLRGTLAREALVSLLFSILPDFDGLR
jgi:hypothetical protein